MTRTDRLTAILDILAKTGQVEVEEIVSQLAAFHRPRPAGTWTASPSGGC